MARSVALTSAQVHPGEALLLAGEPRELGPQTVAAARRGRDYQRLGVLYTMHKRPYAHG